MHCGVGKSWSAHGQMPPGGEDSRFGEVFARDEGRATGASALFAILRFVAGLWERILQATDSVEEPLNVVTGIQGEDCKGEDPHTDHD